MTGIDISFGTSESSTLAPADEDEDFYRFTGVKGDPILIFTDAKPASDEFDVSYPDLVVTLYDANGIQIAENDDPYPRNSNDSSVYTILPEDGTYCVRVTECNVWSPSGCAPAAGISIPDYTVSVVKVDPMLDSVVAETEPNDTAPMGTVMEYSKNMNGQYYISLAYGLYSSAADVDVFTFNIPMDTPVTSGRSICNFDFYPGGPSGSGSTALSGVTAYITTLADPMTKIAEVDVTAGTAPAQLAMPCTFGTDYLFFLSRAAGATADVNDFYFVNHVGGGSNPVEVEPNDTPATAHALMQQDNMDGSFSYFVDADITMAPMDRDFFSIDVPAGPTTVSVACSAQRSGSGLRSFTATVLDSTGMPLASGSKTEDPTADLLLQNVAIPSGATTLIIQTDAVMQATDVTSNSYRCGIHLNP